MDDGGTDAPECGQIADPCQTIEFAIGQAGPGEVINVGAGSYGATTVDESVELRGATGHAAVVAGFDVLADGVIIDGFTVQDSALGPGGTDGPGIQLSGAGTDRTITDNVVRSNVFGLYLGGEDVTVSGNTFEANNDDGAAGGNGIYSDQGARNVSITDNTFSDGHLNASIAFVGSGTPAQRGIAISDNRLDADNLIFLINAENVTISENAISSSSTHAIQLDGGNSGVNIFENGLTDAAWSAVRVSNFFGTGSNSGVTVERNTLTGQNDFGLKVSDGAHAGTLRMEHNRIAGDGPEAVVNEDANNNPQVNKVDARDNWWGCNLGPATGGCTSVVGKVDATHRLQLTVSASPGAVQVGGESSALSLDLTRTSDGAHSTSVPLPQVPVALTTSLGTLTPQAPTLSNGLGSSTLTSGETPGDATVTAQLDHETVSTGVRFNDRPPAQQQSSEQPREEPPLLLEEPGPAPDTVGPAVGLVRRDLRVSRTGLVTFSLFCPRDETAGCAGSALIETANAVRVRRRGPRRKVPLATKSFRLPPGQLSPVQVRLSKARRALVRRLRRVRVNVIVVSTDAAGNSTRISLPMTLTG